MSYAMVAEGVVTLERSAQRVKGPVRMPTKEFSVMTRISPCAACENEVLFDSHPQYCASRLIVLLADNSLLGLLACSEHCLLLIVLP